MPTGFGTYSSRPARRLPWPAPKRGGGVHRLAQSGAGKLEGLCAHRRADEVVLSSPDDRLESERQANRGPRDARAGSFQRHCSSGAAPKVLRCPLVTIYDSPHSAQVLAFAVKLADGGFDDFMLITGEGLTRILSCIDKYEPALRPRFVEGLGKLRTDHARPQTRAGAARAGTQAETSKPPSPPRTVSSRAVPASAGRPARRRAAVRQRPEPHAHALPARAPGARHHRRAVCLWQRRRRRHRACVARTHGRRAKWTPSRSPASCRSSGW